MKSILILLLAIAASAYAEVAPQLDASEEFPGGTGTTSDLSVQAYSHPMSGTQSRERREFTLGNSFFNTVWVASPASTTVRDGLGPIYNAVSCSSCHFKDGRGRGLPETEGKVDVSLLFRLRIKTLNDGIIPHPVYGGQFQPQGIMGVPGEGEAVVRYETVRIQYPDGLFTELLKPVYDFIKLNFGPLGENTVRSPRVAPQMIGLGLLETISEKDILIKEDPLDMDGDGISGRANYVYSATHQSQKLGRFGWKAGKAVLNDQNAAAFNGDIGITSSLHPNEDCTESQVDCLKNHTEMDVDDARLKNVTVYTQLLSVPVRRDFSRPEVQRGRGTFYKINCTACHTPSYTTGTDSNLEILKSQKIYPYTDLLLHDMGDALADDKDDVMNEDLATTREWRTPPLWGLGLTQTVNGHTRYLHDGRARNLEEAILWHGGEAQKSKEDFMKLSQTERDDLILFLNSL
ncbi:di-heme oxidoredictase family protein [Peredibacter sp. HCB2-198]|uniref:di-heme oxidoreductase family protein n=1 Tax=Peredibacter sp. HCB2-198 TaxID=3383025 RepID=UPI0038B45CCA